MKKNIFEQMAKKYDSNERKELAEIIVEKVRPELQESTSKSLIDYGCGTGLVGLELSDLVDSVLLVDISQQMLEIAETKIIQKKITNAKVLFSDFTEMIPEVEADIIFMSLVLLHIPDTKNILQNLFHILNDGGKLIIVDFDKNEKVHHPKIHNGFSHGNLKKMLSDVGFTSVQIETFHHGSRIFAKQDASMFLSSSIK